MTLRHLPEIQLVKNHELTHNGNQLVKKQTSEPVMFLSIEMGVKLGDDWMWAIDFQTGFRHNDVAPRLRPQQNILECRAECHYAEYRGAIESSSVFKISTNEINFDGVSRRRRTPKRRSCTGLDCPVVNVIKLFTLRPKKLERFSLASHNSLV